mmetsp:Transcript_31755/g.84761  ORF Transcript_31755/g.84761 Transcript_31755/m.84761 type:complete len:206 (+) Transcript_31755:761-1378(+)
MSTAVTLLGTVRVDRIPFLEHVADSTACGHNLGSLGCAGNLSFGNSLMITTVCGRNLGSFGCAGNLAFASSLVITSYGRRRPFVVEHDSTASVVGNDRARVIPLHGWDREVETVRSVGKEGRIVVSQLPVLRIFGEDIQPPLWGVSQASTCLAGALCHVQKQPGFHASPECDHPLRKNHTVIYMLAASRGPVRVDCDRLTYKIII